MSEWSIVVFLLLFLVGIIGLGVGYTKGLADAVVGLSPSLPLCANALTRSDDYSVAILPDKKNCWKDSDGCNTICCDNYNYSCTTTLLLCVPDEVVKSWGGVVK